jgi:phosphatidylglycerophosphate synthase
MAVVAYAARDDHPFPRFGAANYVTMFRAMAMALVAGLIGESGSARLLWFTIGIVTLVAVLDGADGWLARRSGMESGFGARFDMETDAALILVLSVLVWRHDKAGGWVLMCGLMRYAFVGAGWLLPWLAAPLRSRGARLPWHLALGPNAVLAKDPMAVKHLTVVGPRRRRPHDAG